MISGKEDRRQSNRLAIEPSVFIQTSKGRLLPGRMVDLSPGGAKIDMGAAIEELRPNHPVRLTIQWTNPAVAWVANETLSGTIRYVDRQRIGIQFAQPRKAPAA